MTIDLNYVVGTNQSRKARLDIPDECSVCRRLMLLTLRLNYYSREKEELQVVFQCTNPACKAFMLSWYKADSSTQLRPVLSKVEPPKLNAVPLSDLAREISADFISIYTEALEAKERGLSQIAGPGYRKAFEFLIKDYAKSKVSSEQAREKIEKSFAGSVVDDFVEDKRVQAVAKRALWIGNDETHYLRKWENRNIDDLIILIELTPAWINIERQSKAYEDEMPESKRR